MLAATAALFVTPWAAQAQYPITTTTSTSTTSTSTSTTVQGATTTTAQATTTTAGATVKDFGAVREGGQFNKQDCGFNAGSTVNATFNGASAGTATVGGDGCVSFNVAVGTGHTVSFNGRSFTGVCGDNQIVVSNSSRTARNTFSITCETATGVAGTTAGTGTGVAVTGAAIGATAVIGTALIVLGFVLVRFARRRRGASAI
jgi:hypothetical protein